MIDRFKASGTGAELLRRADHLKINLYREADGGIQASFELSGSVGQPDDDMLGGVGVAEPNDLRFLGELMRHFEKPSDR
jgi:hypothetical protein